MGVIMETLCKIIIMVLFTLARGEDTQDMEEIKEMMRDMNIRVHKAEEKWTKTEDKLAEALIELAETKTELSETKSEIKRMRNTPYMHACGAHIDKLNMKSTTIPYYTLLYSSTNTEGGGLDIASGVFTSSYPGSYTVTWALHPYNDAGDHYVSIYLQHNGQNIDESHHLSYYSGPGPNSQVWDQGGRTLVLHLDQGDTLQLYCEDCTAYIFHTTFCVSLT